MEGVSFSCVGWTRVKHSRLKRPGINIDPFNTTLHMQSYHIGISFDIGLGFHNTLASLVQYFRKPDRGLEIKFFFLPGSPIASSKAT